MTNDTFPCPGEAPVAQAWKLKTQTLRFSRHPLLMGILNVTSDSFSDGGHFLEPFKAIDQALRMEDAGADILDIGGESTRPYAKPVSLAEELQRVMPVIKALAERTSIPLSIDTSKAEVARQAIDAGVEIINDISGFQSDPDMIQVAVDAKAGVCAMHMQGIPQTMQDNPTYGNLIDDILLYLQARREQLVAAGLDREHICLDPGIGFGKTHQHNLTLLANCWRFHQLGCPLLVGPSRKGFIAKVLRDKETDRTAGTIGVSLSLAIQGIQILRVHNVKAVRQALALFDATGGFDGQSKQLF